MGETIVGQLVSWCFKPSQPQRITLGLIYSWRIVYNLHKANNNSVNEFPNFHLLLVLQCCTSSKFCRSCLSEIQNTKKGQTLIVRTAKPVTRCKTNSVKGQSQKQRSVIKLKTHSPRSCMVSSPWYFQTIMKCDQQHYIYFSFSLRNPLEQSTSLLVLKGQPLIVTSFFFQTRLVCTGILRGEDMILIILMQYIIMPLCVCVCVCVCVC